MANASSAATGPQCNVVAETTFDLSTALPFVVPIALGLIAEFLALGIVSTVGKMVANIADALFWAAVYLAMRRGTCGRAVFSREEATLFPCRPNLRGRPLHFRWDEVLEVRRTSLWRGAKMRLRLNRPRRRFWTFRSQPANSALLPKAIWTDPRFAEALRAGVPPERIHAELAFDERLTWWARYRWGLFAFILLYALYAALAAVRGPFVFPYPSSVIRIILSVMLGTATILLAFAFCIDRAPGAFKVVAGFLNTFVFVSSPVFLLPLLVPRCMALVAGYWGALAGALIGAAWMVIRGKKYRGWHYVAATFLLAATGFCCAWAPFRQATGVRMGTGWLGYIGPWTPKGDAFLMTERYDYPGRVETEQRTVCWYSSDGKLERRLILPAGANLIAVGQEAALFVERGGPEEQLWCVPRDAEPRVIDKAAFEGLRAWVSPDSRHALLRILDENDNVLAWRLCDVDTGKVESVNFPVPPKDASLFAFRDDLTILWTSGSGPMDEHNAPWAYARPLPENGEFPHPGKLYTVWSWKINAAKPPSQLYAAKTQWLECRRSRSSEQLRVRRVSERPPARVEFAVLDFTQSPPAEKIISEREFEQGAPPPPDSSRDGSYQVVGRSFSSSPELPFVLDTKTGRKFPLPPMTLRPLHWSPMGDKFLMEVAEDTIAGGRWRWHSTMDEVFEAVMVVYFVDMDRQ